jgi:hypothetical protein
MATYKILQDIEAEDKLLGPMTLRQFIYAIIVAMSGFVAFRLFLIAPWLILLFLPHMILFAVLASPFGHDQPSEIWLLAKIRFFLKPRRRIWDQTGAKELVTITVPKRAEKQLAKNFTQTEVKSRLQALANTIDSRGWAVKNVNANLYSQPAYAASQDSSDRLIDMSQMVQEVPAYDLSPSDDMFDEYNSPTAQHFSQLIAASAQTQRQQLASRLQRSGAPAQQQAQTPADYWFLNQPAEPPKVDPNLSTFDKSTLVTPGQPEAPESIAQPSVSAQDEQSMLEHIHHEKNRPDPNHSHLRTVQPLSAKSEELKAGSKSSGLSAQDSQLNRPTADPAIAELANNNDLNIETISRQANKNRKSSTPNGKPSGSNEPPDDEVIVQLR